MESYPKFEYPFDPQFFLANMAKVCTARFPSVGFFYGMSAVLLVASIPLGIRIILRWLETNNAPPINSLAFMFTVITGLQALFFAMWFDMDYNKDLR